MAKVYVATLHTGNTLTIHGKTFFKGRPTVVTEQVLIDYLKKHPNFKMDERIVSSKESLEEAQKQALEQIRSDMKEDGQTPAPVVFEHDDKEEHDDTSATKSATGAHRKGAVSAPRPTSKN